MYFLSECFRSEANSEPRHISKMNLSAKIVHGYNPLTIFVKSSISDVPLSFENPSADSKPLLTFSKSQAADLKAN